MPNLPSFHRGSLFTAAMPPVALGTGCVRPLASQHDFFSPLSGTADRIGMQTRQAVSHHRAPQVAHHACGPKAAVAAPQEVTNVPDGPNSACAATGDEALAGLCATRSHPSAAVYGGTSNAYRRWVEDEVRELPDATETAASAGGGS